MKILIHFVVHLVEYNHNKKGENIIQCVLKNTSTLMWFDAKKFLTYTRNRSSSWYRKWSKNETINNRNKVKSRLRPFIVENVDNNESVLSGKYRPFSTEPILFALVPYSTKSSNKFNGILWETIRQSAQYCAVLIIEHNGFLFTFPE